MKQHQVDGLGTQIQNCVTVITIKQVLFLHEHNVTSKSQDIGKVCLLFGKKKNVIKK